MTLRPAFLALLVAMGLGATEQDKLPERAQLVFATYAASPLHFIWRMPPSKQNLSIKKETRCV